MKNASTKNSSKDIILAKNILAKNIPVKNIPAKNIPAKNIPAKNITSNNTPQLRETRIHGNSLFPFMLYDVQSDATFFERINCHWHEEVEILVIERGNGRLYLGADFFSLKTGSICLIPANALHLVTCEIGEALDFYAIVFHPDLLYSLGNDIIQQKFLDPLFHQGVQFSTLYETSRVINPAFAWEFTLREVLDEIHEAFLTKPYGYELLIKAALLKSCHLMISHAIVNQEETYVDSDYRTGLIKSIMKYLQENYDDSVTLEKLEKNFNISKGYLCRSFKSVTHMTPFEYLNYFRISKSTELLLETDREISQIALQTGFNNISYFNRTFQRFIHMTPREFRRSAVRQPLESMQPLNYGRNSSDMAIHKLPDCTD